MHATVKGKITKITGFGAFVSTNDGKTGMIHISEISSGFVKDIRDYLSVGQEVEAAVISTDEKYSLQGTTQGRYLTGGVPPVRFSM